MKLYVNLRYDTIILVLFMISKPKEFYGLFYMHINSL